MTHWMHHVSAVCHRLATKTILSPMTSPHGTPRHPGRGPRIPGRGWPAARPPTPATPAAGTAGRAPNLREKSTEGFASLTGWTLARNPLFDSSIMERHFRRHVPRKAVFPRSSVARSSVKTPSFKFPCFEFSLAQTNNHCVIARCSRGGVPILQQGLIGRNNGIPTIDKGRPRTTVWVAGPPV